MNDEDFITYERAIKKWGKASQVGMLIEEIGELLTAINKIERENNGCDFLKVVTEIVDVEIMLDQYKVILNDMVPDEDIFTHIAYERWSKMKKLKSMVYKDFPYHGEEETKYPDMDPADEEAWKEREYLDTFRDQGEKDKEVEKDE